MLLLDTSAIIELLNGTQVGSVIKQEIKDKELVTTVVNKYEVMVGTRQDEKEKSEMFFEQINNLPLTVKDIGHCVNLNKSLAARGNMINEADIFIAGICQKLDATIVTLDRDFLKVPRLRVKLF